MRGCLITQLAAPGHPRPVPHHLQPGSARNSLGLLPSTRGRQPRVLLWPWGPCSGPSRGARVGAGEEPAGRRSHWPGRPGPGAGGGMTTAAPDLSPVPALFLPLPAAPLGAWAPARPTLLSRLPLSACISPSPALWEGVGAWVVGDEEQRGGGSGGDAGRGGGGNAISRVGPGNSGGVSIRKPFQHWVSNPRPPACAQRGSLPLPRARGQKGPDLLRMNRVEEQQPGRAKARGAFCGPKASKPRRNRDAQSPRRKNPSVRCDSHGQAQS